MRFAGVGENRVQLISDAPFGHPDLAMMEIPGSLDGVSSTDLITHYRLKDGQLVCRGSSKCASQLKLAIVSNWDMECGLALYGSSLANELVELVGDIRIFAEHNPPVPSYINPKLTPDKIVRCWKRGEALGDLIKKIKEYEPDIVLINHEWGLFSNARHWLSFISQLSNFRIIVIMHSIFRHQDKLVAEAPLKEIVVHLDGAKNVLLEKGVGAKIHVIPHGCPVPASEPKPWNFYRSDHTVVQQGFLFAYKGYETSIRAIALLKGKYSDIFFTGLCSESPYATTEHQLLYDRLMRLVDELGVSEHIGLIRGYQPDRVLDTYLRMNRVAIFPYRYAEGHECFGSSGAAPYAMSKGLPVITSSINHFHDLPTVKADSPEALADALDTLFGDAARYRDQISAQNRYLIENDWKTTAAKFVSVFNNAKNDGYIG